MKVALLGATGFVGSALLKEALDRGHTVTAIVRNPEKLEKRDGLIPRTGDVYDAASLAGLIEGNDALISAFNPGWKDPNLYDDQVRGTKSVIEAAKKAGIKRVLWVGGAGGLEVPVVSADGETYEVRNRMTLCRCGRSANKPFCDGSHAA
jgi:putative NADH-flavin reductase